MLWLTGPDLAAYQAFLCDSRSSIRCASHAKFYMWMRSKDADSGHIFFTPGGFVLTALLSAGGCNCSLNKHLSGVASLPFSTGLHSVISLPEANPRRTVAFLCLPGCGSTSGFIRVDCKRHSSPREYIHLMWSRPAGMSLALSETGK